MRYLFLMALCLYALTGIQAQQTISNEQRDSLVAHYTAQAKRFLVKNPGIWGNFGIDRKGVHTYASLAHKRQGDAEFSMRWEDLKNFKRLLKYGDRQYQLEIYNTQRTRSFDASLVQTINILDKNHQVVPVSQNKPLTGLKIAIDPGHIAGSFDIAVAEDRFIEMYNVKGKTYRFFEGELSLTTALILRDSLVALGAEVFLTREKGNYSAMGMSFQEWIHTELVDTLLRKGQSLKQIDRLIGSSSKKKIYKEHFLDMDLDARASRINYFNPHFTVVIHFNADVENEGWFQPTKRNYSMVFVPGSYIGGELSNKTERFDFIRTLLTDHMQESAMLSSFIVNEFETHLGVKSVADYSPKPYYLTKYSIEVSRGVYARNLRLCRLLNTPLCYGESQLQDNIDELEALSQNDLANGVIAPRLVVVAEAYLRGIKRYAEVLRQRNKGFVNRP